MKISWRKLQAFVPEASDPEAAYAALGRVGLEGESFLRLRAQVAGARVLTIVEIAPHPEREQLRILQGDAGGRRVTLVAGDRSLRVGERVAWIPPGVEVAGRRLEARDFAGVVSEGMLASAAELGLGAEDRHVLRLPAEAAPGSELADWVPDDVQMVFGVTPNRGDCLSHLGVARELGLGLSLPLRIPEPQALPADHGDLRIELEDADCPLYMGVLLSCSPADPEALAAEAELVDRCGMRPISPIVDLTNAIMLEFGQPMHAFDADRLVGAVRVRAARAGETLETLDGVVRKLDHGELIIADDEGPIALAGVMGGARTEVGAETRRVLLESAHFAPARVMRSRRPHKLSTEASQRFERGVDPAGVERAAAWFVERLSAASEVRVEAVCRSGRVPAPRRVRWDRERAGRLLGALPDEARVEDIFVRLGLRRAEDDPADWIVPAWRFDLAASVDLGEEIARGWGYERFAPTLPALQPARPQTENLADLRRRIQDWAVARGFQQVIPLSFAEAAEGRVRLANPLGEQTGALRNELAAGLLEAAARNHRHQETDLRLVELGVRFAPDGPRVDECWRIGMLWSGEADPAAWQQRRAVDLYDLKGVVMQLAALFAPGAECREQAWVGNDPRLHPVRALSLELAGRPWGWVAELDRDWAEAADLMAPTVLAELDLEPLMLARQRQAVPVSPELPRTPASQRDLAFVLRRAVSAAELEQTVREVATGPLVRVQVFDVYEGKGIEADHRSLALRMTWRDTVRSIPAEVLDAEIERIVAAVGERHGGVLRA